MIKFTTNFPIISKQLLSRAFCLSNQLPSENPDRAALMKMSQAKSDENSTIILRKYQLDLKTTLPEPITEKSVYDAKVVVCNTFIEKFNMVANKWEELHERYFGKERDFKNYPTTAFSEYHPKVRMGIFPDEWFNTLYEKTGVTGPYLFMWGTILFLIQKEIWIFNGSGVAIPATYLAVLLTTKMIGKTLRGLYQSPIDKKAWFYGPRYPDIVKLVANKSIEVAKREKEVADVNIDLFQAAKENVSLQLESIYRKRNLDVYLAVKNKLDYHKEKELAKKRFQRSYVVNWLVDSVRKDYTPELDKAALTQCINDLKMLASKQHTVSM